MMSVLFEPVLLAPRSRICSRDLDDGYQVESFVHFSDAIEYIAPKSGVTVRDVKELLVNVSSLDAREGKRDGSVMIYKVEEREYYNATGTIGDQRYA